MIEISNFSKKYLSGKNAEISVGPVSLKAEAGSVTGLIGPNGAGKTTVIKAICALHYATNGAVKISNAGGVFYDAAENPAQVRSLVGYVPELSVLPAQLTAAEFLDSCAEIHNISGRQKQEALIRVMDCCSLQKVMKKKIGELSKGFCQRVSFARALIHNPPNIILDEPVNGLDPAQIIQLRTLIKETAKTKTVLISTHLMQEVDALCSEIYIISRGKIAAHGTEASIIKESAATDMEDAFLKVTGESGE